MVSRFSHRLVDLLYRWRSLYLTNRGLTIANHPRETYAHIEFGDISFHDLPCHEANQDGAGGARRGKVVKTAHADLVILAVSTASTR